MLPTGQTCQIGNGERTGTVSQSTLDGRVRLGQKGEKVYLHDKDHKGIFWRAA